MLRNTEPEWSEPEMAPEPEMRMPEMSPGRYPDESGNRNTGGGGGIAEEAKIKIDEQLAEAYQQVEDLEEAEAAIEEGEEDAEDAFLGSKACLPFMQAIMESINEVATKPQSEIVEETCSEQGRNQMWKLETEMKKDVIAAKTILTRRKLRELEGEAPEVTLTYCILAFEKKMLELGNMKKLNKSIKSRKECRREVRSEMRNIAADELDGRMLFAFNSEHPDSRELWGWVRRAWKAVKKGFQKAVVVVTKAIKKVIKVAKVVVKQTIKVVATTAGKIVDSVAEGKFGAVMGHLGNAGKELVKIGVNATKEIGKIGSEAGKELVGIGKDTARDVAKEAVDAAKNAKKNAVAAARKACKESSLAAEMQGNLFIDDAKEKASEAIDSLGATCKTTVMDASKNGDQAIASAEETISDALDSLNATCRKTVMDAKEQGDELIKAAANATGEDFNATITALREAKKEAVKNAMELCGMANATDISDGVEAAQEAKKNAVTTALDLCEASDEVRDRVVEGLEAAKEAKTKFIGDAKDLCDRALDTVNVKFDAAVVAAEEYLEKLLGKKPTKDLPVSIGKPVLNIAKEDLNITKADLNITKADPEKVAAIAAGTVGLLPLINRDEACTVDGPCDACEGDCDEDEDCRGELMCKSRDHNAAYKPVAGCLGLGEKGTDYCYAPGKSKNQADSGEKVFAGLSEEKLEAIEHEVVPNAAAA